LEQARAIVAAKIIGILDDRKLSTRDAEKQTGVSHSEFSRIRNTQLRHFTLDRMIKLLGSLMKKLKSTSPSCLADTTCLLRLSFYEFVQMTQVFDRLFCIVNYDPSAKASLIS
jgi:DNA-binding Xre family transcriptional regulator